MVESRRHLNFSVVSKPTGAACNLDCTYCFFLSKELLYNVSGQRMSEETLEKYIQEYLAAQPDGQVTMLWQGGEPTLRGVEFFQLALELAEKYRRPQQQVQHALQTNATLINDRWAMLFSDYDVLVGVSIDGMERHHDAYRVNKAGRGTHKQVLKGYWKLQEHGVRTNILCTVHAANEESGSEIYQYFRDELNARYLQFIPIVERRSAELESDTRWYGSTSLYKQEGDQVTERSVSPHGYGDFLKAVFDQWIQNDVGEVFVQDIDSALSSMFNQATVCVHAPECGFNFAMEFNGDVYACDHWVEPEWELGNITQSNFLELARTERMKQFDKKKNQQLNQQCRECKYLRFCWGGCPKDRFVKNRFGDEHNYLCSGYYSFYEHIRPDLVAMSRLIRANRAPAEILDPNVRNQFRPTSR